MEWEYDYDRIEMENVQTRNIKAVTEFKFHIVTIITTSDNNFYHSMYNSVVLSRVLHIFILFLCKCILFSHLTQIIYTD